MPVNSRSLTSRASALLVLALIALLSPLPLLAQTSYQTGQHVEPAY